MRSLRRLMPVAVGSAVLAASPAVAGAVDFSFHAQKIVVDDGLIEGFSAPTAIQGSPDGSRLYVAASKNTGGAPNAELGYIHVVDLDGDNNATQVQTITSIYDYGQSNKDLVSNGTGFELTESSQFFKDMGRRVTGLTLAEEGGQPVLYVSHSDPRNNENREPGQSLVDPTSGVLTRLSGPGFGQVRHLVVGLPRSAEHHGPNDMTIDDGWLYLSLGGNTNHGLQSKAFGYYPETDLSASIVRLNLSQFDAQPGLQIDATPGSDFYFTQPCGPDQSPPDGCSAATADPTPGQDATVPGTFERYADGFRNGYDLTWHSNGNLYLNDNGGNDGFGNAPGPGCSGSHNPGNEVDELFLVQPGGYHGHPNPARGQCVWGGGVQRLASYGLHTVSTGITEYLASVFPDAQGTLITSNFGTDDVVYVRLDGSGAGVLEQGTVASGLKNPLSVHTNPSGDLFVAEYGLWDPNTFEISQSSVSVFEPNLDCEVLGGDNDSDGDGISDHYEQLVGTNPCNAADVPPDLDGDGVPDAVDPDIDGDGIPNVSDDYQLDPHNGTTTQLPLHRSFELAGDGWFGSGLPGIQLSSGGGAWVPGCELSVSCWVADRVSVGGAGGFMQVRATDGTMVGDANDQDNALQIGVPANQGFTASAVIAEPFQNVANPAGETSAGVFFGPGEDEFARVAINANGGSPVIELGSERSPYVKAATAPLPAGASSVTLYLQALPGSSEVVGKYKIGSGAVQTLGTIEVPQSWFSAVAPVGLATTRVGNPGASVAFVFQEFSVVPSEFGDPGPGAGPGPGSPAPAPPAPGPAAGALPPAPTSGESVCNSVPERRTSRRGRVAYSASALKIQQNIDSAVLRRLNAINAWIDAGIVPGDLCASAFGPEAFQAGMSFSGGAPHEASPPAPRPVRIRAQSGRRGQITRSRRQLLINENISRALRVRAVATLRRVTTLTGGNLAQETRLSGRAVWPGLATSGPQPDSLDGPATPLRIGPLPRRIPIRESAATVRAQQRRSQASIRIANRALDSIRAGLTGDNFVPGSIGSGRF